MSKYSSSNRVGERINVNFAKRNFYSDADIIQVKRNEDFKNEN